MQPYKQEGLFSFTYNIDTRVVEQSDELVRVYGLRKRYENMPYSFADEVVRDEDRAAYVGMYERILAGDPFATCDFRVKGSEIWSRVSLCRMASDLPTVNGYVQDVSDFYAYIMAQSAERDLERQRRQAIELDHMRLITAVNDTYNMVLFTNLTQNTYHLINRKTYVESGADEDGDLDELIAYAANYVPKEYRETYFANFSRASQMKAHAAGKKDTYWEYQYRNGQGELYWIATHIIFMDDPYSGDVLAITLSQDIDERRHRETAEETLDRNRAAEAMQLSSVVRSAFEAVVSVNLTARTYHIIDGADSFANEIPQAGAMEQLEQWLYDHMVAEFRDEYVTVFNRSNILNAYGNQNYLNYEHQSVEADGKVHWIATEMMMGDNPYSDDLLAILTRRNIDERKQKEEEEEQFRRAKEFEAVQLASVMKTSFETVISINLTSRIYYVVAGEEYFHGELPHEGNLDALISWVVSQMTEEFREDYLAAITRENILRLHGSENLLSYEHKCIEVDGQEHWVATEMMMMGDNPYSDDQLAVVVRRNIDERKQKEEEQMRLLSDALLLAESASRAKSDFLSRVSHDIRTPMNAVIGYATIAASHIEERERVRDCLRKILSSGEHLQGIINDVLDMSRIEAGKEGLNVIRTSISEMVRAVLPMIHSTITQKQINLYVDTIDVRDEFVYADAQKMRQLLLNILGNAAKFTSDGGTISVKIKQTPSRNPGHAVYTFLIKDNGIGMSREFQEHIFETFAQERSSTNSKQMGTGLGMAIAKSYVDMMGGIISVESEIGKGSEFAVKLEFRIQEDVKPDVRLEQLRGYRALVVDDDFQSCDSVVHLLQDIGMRADFTTTGKEALFRTRMAYGDGDSYFAYIIDWIMPDMNGIEVVRQIRKIIGDEVPIIILTAYYWGEIEEEAREAGVTAFCTKPLFASDLTNIFLQHESVVEELADFHGERLLLVEDNDLNREIAKFMLEEIGFEVDVAYDGHDAVTLLQECPDDKYQYVLMDVQMPIMDGIEATQVIRRSDRLYLRTVPIIALTANAFNEDVDRCLAAGMNAHLPKPFKIEDIIDTLNAYRKQGE